MPLHIDAGVGDNMYLYLDWRFSKFEKSNTGFHGPILTHPNRDHYNGFGALVDNEHVQAKNISHNGLIEQFEITAAGKQKTPAASSLDHTQTKATDLWIK